LGPVKDFVRDAWKTAAACAAGAFVLSLLIGLIAANPFGIAVSRAFLFALLFAGLGVGLRAVVKSYLPEAMGASRPAADAGAPAAGGTVDIVLPEDEGLQREAFQGSAGQGVGSMDAEDEPADVLDAAEADEPSQAEARVPGELAEELAEELPEAESGQAAARSGREGGHPSVGSPAGDEEAEEAQPEDELPRSVANVDAGELDALPEIAELEPPSGPKNGPAARVPRSAVGKTPEDAVRNLLANEDPATLARAIRTALKKDEKG
jgi:hypothetical protein